ncbi:hypothetical protein KACC15558_23820 [Brevibacterium ammoniilyticum]|uniref:D-inositol 3-phosphate glycosyltransferase n=1 Tax=Brevibacterium ammoniilyticum TaxID=1046555 RepID=A0ABP9U141_9MICO
MIRVSHLIHSTGFGGVEIAADYISHDAAGLEYRLLALRDDVPAAVRADCIGTGVNSLRSVAKVLSDLDQHPPEVLITSLWRSVLIGALHRFRHPRVPWVVFLHSTKYTHVLDRIAHRVAFKMADRILCDSAAAMKSLVPRARWTHADVARPDSALLKLSRASDSTGRGILRSTDRVRLIYWGRAAAEKRLDRTLVLLAVLERLAPGRFELDVISPHSPTLDTILFEATEQNLSVSWKGHGTAEQILSRSVGASFFVQLSEFEGLGMAVREALSLGIIPVVTPVGEISTYTADGVNAIHVDQSPTHEISSTMYEDTARRILELAENKSAYAAMSRSARTVPDDDFITALETALAKATETSIERQES